MDNLNNLKRKVNEYKVVLNNTISYRAAWKNELKDRIIKQLKDISAEIELPAEVETKDDVENMQAIILSLGQAKSGIYHKVNDDVQRHLIKNNGALIYQQLFNGKIMVLITHPVVEGVTQEGPPKTVAIYRPEEIKPPFIIRHLEDFMKEMTAWEDYDDDDKGLGAGKIGFNMTLPENLDLDPGQ